MLPDLPTFLALDADALDAVARSLADRLGRGWSAAGPGLTHAAAPGLEFRPVPGGTFRPGWSAGEDAVVQRWLDEARLAERWARARPRTRVRRAAVNVRTVDMQLDSEEKSLADRIDAAFGVMPSESTRLVAEQFDVE